MTRQGILYRTLLLAALLLLPALAGARELPDFREIVVEQSPAVVKILVESRAGRGHPRIDMEEIPEYLRRFFEFRGGQPGRRERMSLGSGFIISEDGYIVTNNHVVETADSVVVRLADRREYDAELIGTDPRSDLALLRIEAEDLPVLRLDEDDELAVGEWVLAIGSPFGLDYSVTAGIVSAMGRSLPTKRNENYVPFIQTDVAINPGNSGGPLVNLQGELIGINSAIYSRSGGNQGIGFAIPVDVVRNVTSQLVEQGEVQRGYLGVGFDRVTETLAQALGVPRGSAQITQVQDDTPAAEAGLQQGEIIVAVDGQQLNNFNQLRTIISNKRPGDSISLRVVNQDGDERTVSVELGTRDDDMIAQNQSPGGGSEEEGSMESLGLTLQTVTPRMLEQLGIESADQYQGLMIANINRGSEAYQDAGLRQRDIIVEVDRQRVRDRQEFMSVYGDISSGENFLLRVVRMQGNQPSSFVTALTKP